jgi:hypothetical protein
MFSYNMRLPQVVLKKGEEAEAELNGGKLRVVFKTSTWKPISKPPSAKNIANNKNASTDGKSNGKQENKKPSDSSSKNKKGDATATQQKVKKQDKSQGSDDKKPANSKQDKENKQEKKAGEKRERDVAPTNQDVDENDGDAKGNLKKKKKLVDDKSVALKMLEVVAGKEEGRIQVCVCVCVCV